MASENSGGDIVPAKPDNPGRRAFFKKAADIGKAVVAHQILSKIDNATTAVGAVTAGVGALAARDTNPIAETLSHPPTELPKDVLTNEELESAHIRIVQAPNTKLHLRKAALEVPLFKDAKDGKLDEVVIVLSDDAQNKWPEDVGKLYGEMLNNAIKIAHMKFEEQIPKVEELGTNFISGKAKIYFNQHKNTLTTGTFNWDEYFSLSSTEEEKTIMLDQQHIISSMLDTKMHLKPPGAEIVAGKWWKDTEFIKQNPEYKNKVYIFLYNDSFTYKPHPFQSFPKPNQLKEKTDRKNSSDYIWDGNTAGTIIRHEVGHYDSDRSYPNSEAMADYNSYFSIEDAWFHFRNTGNNSKYWAIFETDEGITITQKPQEEPVKA